MAAVVMDPALEVETGATLTLSFIVHDLLVDGDGELILDGDGNPQLGDPSDLSDVAVARMQVRKKPRGDTVYMYGDSSAFDEETSPQGERIFLESDGETGRIDVIFTDLDTMGLQGVNTTVQPAYFDFELEYEQQDGELRPFVERILEGPVLVDPNTTRTET